MYSYLLWTNEYIITLYLLVVGNGSIGSYLKPHFLQRNGNSHDDGKTLWHM